MRKIALTFFILSYLSLPYLSHSQDITNSKFGNGVQWMARDSSFSLKAGFRMQMLYSGEFDKETDQYHDQFMIRRARLKFDGFAYTPALEYKVELGLSSSDLSGGDIPESSYTSRIILDAVLKYKFYRNWSIWIGQTKLPGNIERVISSQQLQFVDRSNLNSRFNIDRDAGIQLRYSGDYWRFSGSVSMGEGRDITSDNAGGYDYTLRTEWLPFGKFTGKGDYSASDLKREESPKLMLAVTYDYNDRAGRQRGQLGDFMTANRSLETWFADAHFKYKGFSSMAEFASKTAPQGAVIYDETDTFVEAFYTGTGINWQAGYLFRNNWEVAARFTDVIPEKETLRHENIQYTAGVSRYIVGHNLKIQSDITLIQEENSDDVFMYRFQVELAL